MQLPTRPPAVLVQGITGRQGSFHTNAMLEAGTHVVAGVTPGKAGEKVHGVPVYNTVQDATKQHKITAGVIFVPAPFAKSAALEAMEADIKLIVIITEGIPVHDMLAIRQAATECNVTLVGPNTAGILAPGQYKLGITPHTIGKPGSVAIASRSGTLTYEVADALRQKGIGQKYIIGIGGDPIHGVGFIECLDFFEHDPDVSHIVLVGEIGGPDEHLVAQHIKNHIKKPVFAYVAGHTAPTEVQLGHAGAIMGNKHESAQAKTAALKAAGATIADNLVDFTAKISSKL